MANRKITVGIFAHVDAGKTTLSESLLYLSGRIRRLGRVDHKDTYLDTDPMERERGITIFSKQARLSGGDADIVLLDTPGHVDFSAEAERTLSVLDYAVLVISATDGVQNHTLTLWELLRSYGIPVFLFINKTDLPNGGEDAIMKSLRARLDKRCLSFTDEDVKKRDLRLAETSEKLLDLYLENGSLDDASIASEIAACRIFPCFFGSALRLDGVDVFFDALCRLTVMPSYPAGFAARVFKIERRDGQRLTFLKVTGGSLRVRDEIAYIAENGEVVREKVTQIRLYSGEKYTTADVCHAGEICTVPGFSSTYAGLGLGNEPDSVRPVLEPVLTYRIRLPEGCDVNAAFRKLRELEEEDPTLRLVWEPQLREIHARLMGEVQIDVLKRTILDRFGLDVEMDSGSILYKETIAHPAEGVGHFEPLRHYAEVHLLLEPLPRGSGLILDTRCSEDELGRNWQRLIMTHLAEKTHVGVLTGSPVTDMRISLLTGRSHEKHTEGGDFREATYRAVRQGLMQTESVLLEPYYHYILEVPADLTGRAMTDMQTRFASFTIGEADEETVRLTGRGPVASLRDYARELTAYSHGKGRFFCRFDGYAPCHNAEEVIAASAYKPEADLDNTPDSVFCAHGAGFVVPWNEVRDYMNVDSGYSARGQRRTASSSASQLADAMPLRSVRSLVRDHHLDDKELEAIMERTFGPVKRRQYGESTVSVPEIPAAKREVRKTLLVVDGYNLIFAWQSLKEIADDDLEKAREVLTELLINYNGFTKTDVILVFDAYNVKGGREKTETNGGLKIVFTAENMTADTYIEKLVHDIGKQYAVRVVTSDRLIQLSAVASGVMRLSAREFIEEIERVSIEISEFIRKLAESR